MNPPARRFVLVALSVVGSVVIGIAAFNFLVDPYNRYGNNRLGVYISAARESKSTQVRRFPHNALLLGNSRMAMIPVDKLQHFQFFNAAFSGGTAEEAYYFLEHYAKKEDVVILGVDLGQVDPASPNGDIFAPADFATVLDNLLSMKTVEYSFRSILDHLSGKPPSFAPDGSAEMETWFRLYEREDPAYFKWQLEGLKRETLGSAPVKDASMAYYRKLAALLRERGIACVVCVPPMHEALAREIHTSPTALAAFQAWRSELDAIFPHVVDLSFSSYDAAGNYFKADSKHFKPDVGVLLLNTEVIPVAERAVQERGVHAASSPGKR